MKIFKQKQYSWNSWLDEKIENSEKRIKSRKANEQSLLESRTKQQIKEDNKLSKKLKREIKKSGTDVVYHTKGKGASFVTNPEWIDPEVRKKIGLGPIREGHKTIILGKNTALSSVAHELGHSIEDPLYRWANNGDQKISTFKRTLEETRANLRGYLKLRKMKSDKGAITRAKEGLKGIEKFYLEKGYQELLKSLKRK